MVERILKIPRFENDGTLQQDKVVVELVVGANKMQLVRLGDLYLEVSDLSEALEELGV